MLLISPKIEKLKVIAGRDLAVLKLSESIAEFNKYIRPIYLVTGGSAKPAPPNSERKNICKKLFLDFSFEMLLLLNRFRVRMHMGVKRRK